MTETPERSVGWRHHLYKWGEMAKSVVAIGTVAGAILGGAVYVYRLEERLRTAEAQIQAIASTPKEISASSGSATIAADPIAQSCANLALRAADLHEKGSYVSATSIEDLMEKLRCANHGK